MQDNSNTCQSSQQQDNKINNDNNSNNMPTTSNTSSTRHYVDKARLIQLVHDNPILWDCRLPNYKRADKSKTDQWNNLGSIFNVSGERVQRTFTSLREIFRRELNNEKLLGRRFKSKWEFYKSMSFLRDVIRERKPRERHSTKTSRRHPLSPSINTNPPSNSNGIDEYQYFAPNDPNNPSIQQQLQTTPTTTTTTAITTTLTANNENQSNDMNNTASNSATNNNNNNKNNSQISVLNLLTQFTNGNSPQHNSNHQQQSQQQQQAAIIQPDDDDDVDIIQPSPATSTTPSMYIKDEIEIPDDDEDDEDSTSITFNGELLYRNNNNNNNNNTNNKINLVSTNLLNDGEQNRLRRKRRMKFGKAHQSWKRFGGGDISGGCGGGGGSINVHIDGSSGNVKHQKTDDCEELEDDYEDDVDEDDGSSVQSVPNNATNINNNNTNNNSNNINSSNSKINMLLTTGMLNNLNDETKIGRDLVNEQMSTVSGGGGMGGQLTIGGGGGGVNSGENEVKYRRHLVYTKFADFIVAKMDAMSERDADDLMDRMMLVIAQKH